MIPARDEADVIAESLGSLLRQDYPGPFTVVLVDDQSRDSTAAAAHACAARHGAADRLAIVPGRTLPAGWSGKVWAMKQGIDRIESRVNPAYLLLTDADIAYAPDALRTLVARAQARNLVLTSLMAKLRCETWAERTLIPAFIFFFQMVYPFAWVNRPQSSTAAAAGGCMLVRRDALEAVNTGLFCQLITIPLFEHHKILIQVAGHGSHTIKLLPALIISEADCEWIERAFATVIADAHRVPGAVWSLGRTLMGRAIKARAAV